MEFSFDRSKDSHLRSSAPSRPESRPAAAEPAPAYDDGIDTSTIQNERLRKAIERNRARQAERNRMRPAAEPVQQAVPRPQQEPMVEQATLFEKQASAEPAVPIAPEAPVAEEPVQEAPVERPRATERARMTSAQRSSAVVTRRGVARPDETDFTPAKRTPRKVASQISYSTTGSSKKKSKPIDPTLVNYLVKGCWIFCGIMVLRLIFANGGVTDFYSRKSILNDRLAELDRIKKENMQLVREIERMQTDSAFQKKLVRDNLGFIAADEFLILFPKEKSVQ